MKVVTTVTLPGDVRGCFGISADRDRAVVTCASGASMALFTVSIPDGELVALGPCNGVVAVDASARIAAVTLPGRTVGGVYTSATQLRRLDAKGRGTPLHASTPDDGVSNVVLDDTGGWAVRTRGKAAALVRFGRDGRLGDEWPVPEVTPVTALLLLPDGRLVVFDWNNRVALFDPTTERFAPLTGNPVDWGGDHDLIAYGPAADGDLLISQSHDGAQLHVWSLAQRMPLAGPWSKAALTHAGLLGDGKHVMAADAETLTIHVAATGATVASVPRPVGTQPTCAGDGRHVVLAGPTSVEAWDVWSGARTQLARVGRARVNAYDGVVAILAHKTVRFATAAATAAGAR